MFISSFISPVEGYDSFEEILQEMGTLLAEVPEPGKTETYKQRLAAVIGRAFDKLRILHDCQEMNLFSLRSLSHELSQERKVFAQGTLTCRQDRDTVQSRLASLKERATVPVGLPGSKRESATEIIQDIKEKGVTKTISDLGAATLVGGAISAVFKCNPVQIILGAGSLARQGKEFIEDQYQDKIYDFEHVDPEHGPVGPGQAYMLCQLVELPSNALGRLGSFIQDKIHNLGISDAYFNKVWEVSQKHLQKIKENVQKNLESHPGQCSLSSKEIEEMQREYWNQGIAVESGMSYDGAKAVASLLNEIVAYVTNSKEQG